MDAFLMGIRTIILIVLVIFSFVCSMQMFIVFDDLYKSVDRYKEKYISKKILKADLYYCLKKFLVYLPGTLLCIYFIGYLALWITEYGK